MDRLEEMHYFSSPVYTVKKPEFLEAVKGVSDKYLEAARNGIQLTVMTQNFGHEPDVAYFAQYVSQTAWNILASQGYAMEKLVTHFTEMWTQEHNPFSSMDYHVHGMGAQISAFYFLDVPQDGCQMILHDPRPAKMMINMPAKDPQMITQASPQIVITPTEGMIVFTNAWLPHSFTKNFSQKPTRFVHMNLSISLAPEPEVEVV